MKSKTFTHFKSIVILFISVVFTKFSYGGECPLPSLSLQQGDTTICAGVPVSFYVVATGTGTLTYQWQKNKIDISGETNNYYNITNAVIADAAIYNVVIMNTDLNCTPTTLSSTNANLIVNAPPLIAFGPSNVTKCKGQYVDFSVSIGGPGGLYQWRKGGNDILNATGSIYSITTVVASDTGSYDVVVSGTCGPSDTSTSALLTVDTLTFITSHPSNITLCAGENAGFSVLANGSGLGYQWRKDGNNINGATVNTYTISSASLIDSASYDVVVTGSCSAQSLAASLIVNPLPQITCPVDISKNSEIGSCGAVVNFNAILTGSVANVSYSKIPGDIFTTGITPVIAKVTDNCGNKQCSFNVTIVDQEAPVIRGISTNMVKSNDAGSCSAVVYWAEPIAIDNCSGVAITQNFNPGDALPLGLTTVTYTAMDANGNSINSNFTIKIKDDESPVIAGMPANIVQSNDSGLCNGKVHWTAPVVYDNCKGTTIGSSHKSGDVFQKGTTIVNYTALDAHGNSVQENFTVTINDTQGPVLDGIPTNIIQSNNTGLCMSPVTWTPPVSRDNCPDVAITSNHNPGEVFAAAGSTIVTYTATDIHGNSTSASFTIEVIDNDAPVALCKDIIVPLDEDGLANIQVDDIDNGSTDNCGLVSKSINKNSFNNLNLGNNTVILTVSDINNASSCSAIVNVVSTTSIKEDNVNRENKNYTIYPNPSSGELILKMNMVKSQPVKIKILNPEGQIVYEQQFERMSGMIKKNINLDKIANGIYFMEINTSEEVVNKKIVIQSE